MLAKYKPRQKKYSKTAYEKRKKENPQKIRDYALKNYYAHKQVRLEYSKKYAQTLKGKFISYKVNARIRGIDFKLTMEDFSSFWQKNCAYCNDYIETIGLDRIDNKRGYDINNIISCCRLCNFMKKSLSTKVFLNQCEKISSKLPTE